MLKTTYKSFDELAKALREEMPQTDTTAPFQIEEINIEYIEPEKEVSWQSETLS